MRHDFGLPVADVAGKEMLDHEFVEPIPIELWVDAREGSGVNCPVLECEPLSFELLPLVVFLQEINDANPIVALEL